MGSLLQCRRCGEKDIDKEKQKENVEWVKVNTNYYFHKKCYDEWMKGLTDLTVNMSEEDWFDLLWLYLRKDVKMQLNYFKITNQWEKFINSGMTPKGLFLTFRYHYDHNNGDPRKAEGGIGIAPYIYQDAREYWEKREKRERGICQKIQEQMVMKYSQEILVKSNRRKKKKEQKTLLEEVMGGE